MLGDKSIWELPKTAFLCSDKYSAGSVLKSYDWAAEMKRAGRCVISGFQSKLEKDVFEILTEGGSPVILALARGIYEHKPAKYRERIEAGRLLIVSQFEKRFSHPNRSLAFERNRFIIESADETVFAHIHPDGMLERLAADAKKPLRILDREV
jgi:predicted Rossmann fold nucleotide-binding protein DprA/Smf involved in DNA uptake